VKTKHKIGFGAALAVFGGIGIILGPLLGFTHLGKPWSFITGFAVGVICAAGVVLSIFALLENRKTII